MTNIHIVFGTCGEYSEYSDRREWPVMAYTDRDKADKHADNATQAAFKLYNRQNKDCLYDSRFDIPDGANLFDPDMQTDYTGTDYYVVDVELAE